MKRLGNLTDKELRDLAKEKTKQLRKLGSKYYTITHHYYELKGKVYDKRAERREILVERGKRKGLKCPAVRNKDWTYSCLARQGWTYCRDLESLFAKFCAPCRLDHNTARTKATFKKIMRTKD